MIRSPTLNWFKWIFIGVTFLRLQSIGYGQSCDQILQDAERFYREGKIELVREEDFSQCLEDADTQNKVEAYKLIILSNIYRNQPPKAKEFAKKLLRVNPDYRLDEEVEPEEYVLLFRSLRRHPVFSYGVNGGINTTYVDSYHNFSVDNSAQEDNYNDFRQLGIQLGLSVALNLSKDLQLLGSFQYEQLTYQIKNEAQDQLFSYTDQTYKEILNYVSFPLSFQLDLGNNYDYMYDLDQKRKSSYWFIHLGGQVRYLIKAQADLIRSDGVRSNVELNGEPVQDLRENLNFAVFAGGGMKYRLSRGFLTFEARFTYGLNNLADSRERYNNPRLLYQGGYIDDNFRLHSVSLTVGYYRSIFKPK